MDVPWTSWAKALTQAYILMNLMELRISFIFCTRLSATATPLLLKYAVSLELNI